MNSILYAAAGLIVIIGTLTLYFGKGGPIPQNLADWASFGTYVGGIIGPLLSFIALIAVTRTMNLQRATLELDQKRQLADQHLRWLDALYRDLREELERPVSENFTLRAVLDGDVDASAIDQKRFTARLDNLMQILAQYCSAVSLYRENISEFYDLRIYADRGGRLLDAIKPFHRYLGSMIQPTIEFCDMHLRGESKRANPEAMTRSSRKR